MTTTNTNQSFNNLLKAYGCKTKEEYYNLIIESFTAGSNRNTKNLFRLMESQRKEFLTEVLTGQYDTGLSDEKLADLFEVLI